jgi:predicted alpha/beta hydrolase family esterase
MNSQKIDCNVILMHGKNTNPSEKRYPWLKEAMEEYDIPYIGPKLPDADDPEIQAWVDKLDMLCPDEDSILVGHSRGGVAILRRLEQQDPDVKVTKVILVATNSGLSEKRMKSE